MIKNGADLVRLNLALLDEIHYAGDASERERAICHRGNRRVKFQPGIRQQSERVPNINWRDESKRLNQDNQRRGDGAHEREPVSRSDQQIDERNRPRHENEHLKQVRQGTTAKHVASDGQERGLKDETESDRDKVKPGRAKNSGTHGHHASNNGGKKTKRRDNEKLTIHGRLL